MNVICVHEPNFNPLAKVGPYFTCIESNGPFAYWEVITEYWKNHTPFINVEQDIEAEQKHINELFTCPHPFCAFGFYTYLDRDIVFDGNNELYYKPLPPQLVYSNHCGIKGKPEFCTSSGIGLIKFGLPMTKHLKKMPWFCLDWVVTDVIRAMGHQFHIHYPPVEHNRDPNYYQKESPMYSLWEDSPEGSVIYNIDGKIIKRKNQIRATKDIGK